MIEEDFKKRAARYIKEILNYINTQFPGKLVSLILFGSSVNGIPTKISDVDLLIVLNDKVTKREMQRIRLRVEKLAVKYRFWSYPQSLFERILRGVKLSTGMFVPFFVTREKDLLSGKFTRIFNVNRVLAFFLSPKEHEDWDSKQNRFTKRIISQFTTINSSIFHESIRRRSHKVQPRSIKMGLIHIKTTSA